MFKLDEKNYIDTTDIIRIQVMGVEIKIMYGATRDYFTIIRFESQAEAIAKAEKLASSMPNYRFTY